MTSTTPAAPAAPGWTAGVPAPRTGLASRLVAGPLFVATGLAVTASVVGIAVAQSIVARGIVVADAADVATLNALAPVTFLFAVVGIAHAIAGLGILFGSRQAAALGIGLGAFDIVAGIVAIGIAVTGPRGMFDGVSLAVSFIVLGIVLAVAARVADWNTHGPLTDEA